MSDTIPADGALTDMAPFFERYDRKNRRLMAAALCVSLVLSAVIATRLLTGGATGLRGVGAMWGVGVACGPLMIAGWSTFGHLMALGRRKEQSLDGRHPASEDDARNGMRIANAGFLYNLGLIASVLIGQVLIALLIFRYQVPGVLIARDDVGGRRRDDLPRQSLAQLPTPRTPDRKAAIGMKVNRFSGWAMVIAGLLIVLLGVFLPQLHPR